MSGTRRPPRILSSGPSHFYSFPIRNPFRTRGLPSPLAAALFFLLKNRPYRSHTHITLRLHYIITLMLFITAIIYRPAETLKNGQNSKKKNSLPDYFPTTFCAYYVPTHIATIVFFFFHYLTSFFRLIMFHN